MKIGLNIKTIVEFDEAVSPAVYDDFLKAYFERTLGNIEIFPTFGDGEYILIIKDKISDK